MAGRSIVRLRDRLRALSLTEKAPVEHASQPQASGVHGRLFLLSPRYLAVSALAVHTPLPRPCPRLLPAGITVMRATFWHGSLRKDKG
jgi:hypothetical protein